MKLNRKVLFVALVAAVFLALILPVALALAEEHGKESRAFLLVARNIGGIYAKSVVIAVPMPEGGHLGVMLNRLRTGYLSDIPGKGEKDGVANVYFGGPWSFSNWSAMVAGPAAKKIPRRDKLEITGDAFWVFDPAVITEIIKTPALREKTRFFSGYILWDPGEVEQERKGGYWDVLEVEEGEKDKLIFTTDEKRFEGLWEELHNRIEKKKNTI